MDERKLLEQLKRDAEQITPPESLQPDAIENMLRYAQKRNGVCEEAVDRDTKDNGNRTDNRGDGIIAEEFKFSGAGNEQIREANRGTAPSGRKKSNIYRLVIRCGSAAAIFLLGITTLYQSRQISKLSRDNAVLVEEAKSQKAQENNIADAEPDEKTNTGEVTSTDTIVAADTEVQTTAEESQGRDAAPSNTAGNQDGDGQKESDTTDSSDADASDIPKSASEMGFSGDSLPDTAELTEEAEPELPEAFTYCESYQQIYDTLTASFGTNAYYDGGDVVFYAEAMAEDTAEVSSAQTVARGASYSGVDAEAGDFSQTNLQELGVDEADIVKTDGKYLYILRQDCSFTIVSAEGTVLAVMSAPKLDTGLSSPTARELYLDGDTLNVVADGRKTSLTEEDNTYYTTTGWETQLFTYDVTDRSQPVLEGRVSQEGSYKDSRKVGRYIYLFTAWSPELTDTYQNSAIAPRINDEEVPAGSIYMPEHLSWMDYLVISSLDTAQPDEVLDRKVLVSGASDFYVSPENIYITNQAYVDSTTLTEITKFHYAKGKITGVAAASVEGYLNNSFSLNEYQGTLRVVSTYYDENWDEWNALYVLDENLNQLSSIRDLAKGETIRSARFFGDTGYFVTFRQTDPLFSVDLSDPSNPRVLGELKISGFSSYLHFYGENQLLGIGYEADEDTGIISGLKLSMFDISDPANVTETDRLVLPGITWCPAIGDYKAILADPEKNLIGFFCDNRYFVYSYDEEKGFTRELIHDFYSDNLAVEYDNMRGLYIGDVFYLAGDGFVISLDMKNDFKQETYLSLS